MTEVIYTPWKILNEILMYAIKPLVIIYLKVIHKVKIGKGSKFYGFPKIFRHAKGRIIIGDNFECRSWRFANPLGIDHPVIISAWSSGSTVRIGNDVGISGGAIVSSESIKIGNGVLIGANTEIVDTDFHPIKSANRRYESDGIKSKPVVIGNNVFIGTRCIILKGVIIGNDLVVPAGSVVRR